MLSTTEGVVIFVREVGDNDRWMKVLSPEMGLIEITAKGAKKHNSPFNSTTQLFSCAKFCFNERAGRYYLNSSEPVKTFYELRLDLLKLSLAAYMAEIISYAVTEQQTARDVYRLFMNSLYMLCERKADCRFIKLIFELRISADLGMMPDLFGCKECYRADIPWLYFFIRRGIFLCEDHMVTENEVAGPYVVKITMGTFEAMRFICLADMNRIFNFRLSRSALDTLAYIAEQYCTEQLNRYFKTLSFYKELEEESLKDEELTNEQLLQDT